MKLSQQDLQILRRYRPKLNHQQGTVSAATAIILRDSDKGTEFLLMQRAIHDADPWSGQMSFPGGKVEATDLSKKAAAIRETAEEVSIQLLEAEYIAQLDDIFGQNISSKSSLHLSSFVFKTDRELAPKGNHEVADLVWLPMSFLNESDNAHEFYHPRDASMKMPAVLIDQQKSQILWGLSLRMLKMLYAIVDKPMMAAASDIELR
ncbi:MAG: CoA pyrophosphatase [Acidiferrobacterales bacterium]|nr:CoA pyrophosphatase [Acidiferrobacterales bacterium]